MNHLDVTHTEYKHSLSNAEEVKDIQNRLLRIDEVSSLTSLAKPTIRLWVAQSKFPAPLRLSPTINAWRLIDVNDWISAKHGDSVK
ncbi:AlpA family phage regulatory protein [Polynucleobacter sp. AP-Capit-er-40B-B4]|uniref:helix-turn-helix transcriptional regulator n=1 Tax=Polynucleobacter sp. AP-Capit-er-40B-B4 TaxID=2576927 RepID=UPI001C0CA3C6|nr:AlpA family phage regulatory protein [Polynucleobacter sp. AP-Capit-er-40B-B4]MBU3582024.1 AlpA family phage regulatory protein [Polynucleobacter sp. AP-Capit-er-40B-B4]